MAGHSVALWYAYVIANPLQTVHFLRQTLLLICSNTNDDFISYFQFLCCASGRKEYKSRVPDQNDVSQV